MDRLGVEDFFAAFRPVRARPMFGGHAIYCDEFAFALEMGGEFYLKVDPDTQALFQTAGSEPFIYQSKRAPVRMSYWRIPAQAVDNDDELRRWCGLAIEAARRAHTVRKRVRRRA